MEAPLKRKKEEEGGGEAKKRKKEKDFIRGKLGGPYEQYCTLFLKHRAQEEEKFSKWKIEASNFMFWRYFDQPQRDVEFDLWGETKVSRVPELEFHKTYVYYDDQAARDSDVLLVGECALTSQILGEKFKPRHRKPNNPSQIEDQILFLQKYVATTRQKIAYFIVLGSVPSEMDETALKELWNRLDGQKQIEKEHWFGFGLAIIPALTEEVFRDMVVMTSQLQGAFVSLDTFREQQEEKNEEMTERLNSIENENTNLKTRLTSFENENTDLNTRLALIEEQMQKLMK